MSRGKRTMPFYRTIEEFELPDDAPHILKDERIEIIYTDEKEEKVLRVRRVAVYSEKYNTAFVYITNNFELTATEIAAIYQNRWQIEVFFKKLKQNFPLTYFYGDNTNAIEIQIWCALIALLLLQVLHKEQKIKTGIFHSCNYSKAAYNELRFFISNN